MQIVLYNRIMENVMINAEYGKRGYLKENFRVFYNKDIYRQKFDFHYHEFDKMVLFKSGKVCYIIEGKEYNLTENDILLVRHGDIHKPVIRGDVPYERIIIWINSSYLKESGNLSACFDKTKETGLNLLRLPHETAQELFSLAEKISTESETAFAAELMKESLFNRLMILTNRAVIHYSDLSVAYKSDRQTDEIIHFIKNNLFKPLSVDKIAAEFYLSRYYLMHKFKNTTGKTIYSYILSKRLLHACSLLENGVSAKNACFESGFNNYSVFLKAFKKEFECSPSEYIKKEKM